LPQRSTPCAQTRGWDNRTVRRLLVDLNWGGRLDDGRGITMLVRSDRRNGDLPRDITDGEAVLLADEDEFSDGSPAWIEIPAEVVRQDDGWSAVWNWDARRWVPRQ
jgi:hypothetical protein